MNDKLGPMAALDMAAEALRRAHEIAGSFSPTEQRLEKGELNVQLAHACMRYVELTTVKEKAE